MRSEDWKWLTEKKKKINWKKSNVRHFYLFFHFFPNFLSNKTTIKGNQTWRIRCGGQVGFMKFLLLGTAFSLRKWEGKRRRSTWSGNEALVWMRWMWRIFWYNFCWGVVLEKSGGFWVESFGVVDFIIDLRNFFLRFQL